MYVMFYKYMFIASYLVTINYNIMLYVLVKNQIYCFVELNCSYNDNKIMKDNTRYKGKGVSS